MKFRNLIAAAALAALPLSTHAATLVVPVVGTGPGVRNSQWQSELTMHTAGPRPVTLSVTFHRTNDILGPIEYVLQPRSTLSIADIVNTQFLVNPAFGALEIEVADRDARSLAVTSRTSNTWESGEFGQDIPAIDKNAALRAGDIAAIPGPVDSVQNRFNFGIYTTEATTVEWQVIRQDGQVGATKTETYTAGSHAQYNGGIQTLIGATAHNNDTVHARVVSGRAIFYGSIINNTGDPTFVPGIRTREDILIELTGVDLDENGSVDVRDDNGDAVLDTPVRIFKSLFPNYFSVIAQGEFGEEVTLEVVSGPGHTELLSDNRTLIVIVGADVTTSTGEIVLKATSEGSTQLITIPVTFR
ncbi:MAG TPA: hypothetical protein VGQ76_15620 [Thermoanaerobaculia bacterium]|jgi:hypothetical protein|nr:hypothetical protein [Thermoanaerobaculia bacterium]